jgi:hypothetical protein
MENFTSTLLVLQGCFWMITPFLFKKCGVESEKVKKYLIVMLGAVAIMFAMIVYFRLGIKLLWYLGTVLFLGLVGLAMSFVNYSECGSSIVIIEGFAFCLAIVAIIIYEVYNPSKLMNYLEP